MGDEEVIRRRLLVDGDGTGDDRRLNVLLKTFIKWCMAEDETPEESQLTYERMLAQLAQCEYTMKKSQLALSMSAEGQQKYDQLYGQIAKRIETARKDIDTTKSELREAKRVRKNKMEYDALAQVIQKQPDRTEMGKKLAELQLEMDSLQDTKQKLENKLDMRRKHFHVLVTSIHQLQALLDSDEEQMDSSFLKDEKQVNTSNVSAVSGECELTMDVS